MLDVGGDTLEVIADIRPTKDFPGQNISCQVGAAPDRAFDIFEVPRDQMERMTKRPPGIE